MTALNLYWAKPNTEKKAAKELRQAKIKAYVPKEKRDGQKKYTPTANGYIAAASKPHDAVYVKQQISGGTVTRQEWRKLYVRSSRTQRYHKFATGEIVQKIIGKNASTLVKITECFGSGWYEIEFEMMGKTFRNKIHERDLAKQGQIIYEPG
jgi:hypothetical protein